MDLVEYLKLSPSHLKELRLLAGMHQSNLAAQLDRPQSTISGYENGTKGTRIMDSFIIPNYIKLCGKNIIVVQSARLEKKEIIIK